ncbi:MAG: tyrosine-type recombinase/integrase [Acidimicrobiales bacterium]
MSRTFFDTVARYLNAERPPDAATDHVLVALKGPTRGRPLSADGLDIVLRAARDRAGLTHATCHELRHTCLTRLREAGMALEALQAQAGHRSINSTRLYLHLSADWLADEYRRAAESITRRRTSGRSGERRRSRRFPRRADLLAEVEWARVPAAAPVLAATIRGYLDRLEATLASSSVRAVEVALHSTLPRSTFVTWSTMRRWRE